MDMIASRNGSLSLAVGRDSQRFDPDENAAEWLIQRDTGKPGRPGRIYQNGAPLSLPLEADYDDLCEAVEHKPGMYRLVQLDSYGHQINGAEMAYVPVWDRDSIVEEHALSDANTGEESDDESNQLMGLCSQLIASREKHDEITAQLFQSVVQCNVALQENIAKQQAAMQTSMAGLLNAASTTIKVANGIDALERPQPQVDIAALSETIDNLMATHATPPKKGLVDFFTSPTGGMIVKAAIDTMQGFAQAALAHQMAMAEQAQAEANGAAASQAQTQPTQALQDDVRPNEHGDAADDSNDTDHTKAHDGLNGQDTPDICNDSEGKPDSSEAQQNCTMTTPDTQMHRTAKVRQKQKHRSKRRRRKHR